MSDNLAYIETEELQLVEETLEIQEEQDAEQFPVATIVRQVDVVWLKKGNIKTHAFHKNGSFEISMCGQIVLEEIREASLVIAKESNCPRCEKFIRRLSRIKPTSSGLKSVLDLHNQSELKTEVV